MSRPWRSGQPHRSWMGLALLFLVLAGIGTVFGLRVYALTKTAEEVRKLREEQTKLWSEIEALRAELGRAGTPKVVEQKAREVLRWAYPEEELVILIRRR